MVRFAKTSCFILLLFFALNIQALGQGLLFRNYYERDGLPSPTVAGIYQDSRGYLWVGTKNGLSRFDGVQFKNFKQEDGLADNDIKTILEDRAGNIWVGSIGGASCVVPHGFGNYSIRNYLTGSSVYSIKEDRRGKLWFGTSDGLVRYDGKNFRHFTEADGLRAKNIFQVVIEKEKTFWLGTDKGLVCYENENFIDYSEAIDLTDQAVHALSADSSGSLWLGTKKGLNRLSVGKLTTYTTENGLVDDHVNAVMQDSDGNTWVGTWEGVSVFTGGKILNYGSKNGLPHNFIYTMAQDREGNTWFGTIGGLSCLTSLNIKTFSRENGLPGEMVLDIIQDRTGRYWIGTAEGLSCYYRGTFKNYTVKDGLGSNSIDRLMEDRQGNIWIATLQGLSVFSPGSIVNYTKADGLAHNVIFALAEDRDGTVWIGSMGGLTRFIDGKFSAPPFNIETTAVSFIMIDSRGDLWFSSLDKLYLYAGNRLKFFVGSEAPRGDRINEIFEDSRGQIWAASSEGLSRFQNGTFVHYPFESSTLVDIDCHFILEDSQGHIWTGNSRGLACFDGQRFQTYTTERLGLTGRTWDRGIRDNRGELWFASSGGVTAFYPPPVELNITPPPIYITGVKVMEKEISPAQAGRFGASQNIFRFNFVGISLTSPGDVSYKYMLENIDTDWRVTRDRSLFYPFLPPGSYALQIKAVNNDGFESIDAAEYRFKILPHFWKTWWFLVIVGLAASLLVLAIIRWRVKRAAERAEIAAGKAELETRNRQLVMSQRMQLMGTLAAGTVHDLKNLMTVIITYSQIIGQKRPIEKEDSRNIEIIKRTASTAVQMAKQILSFADPKSSDLDDPVDLANELTAILDTVKVSKSSNIRIQWEPPGEPIYFPIRPARFQQLVMNLCMNACYAMPAGGELGIYLSRVRDNEIVLEITDTGTGIRKDNLEKIFDPLFTTREKGKGTGLGLFVVKQIVTEYDGDIEVRSEPGKGSAFIIRLPVRGGVG